jgi:hypothetical protein
MAWDAKMTANNESEFITKKTFTVYFKAQYLSPKTE